MVREKVTKKKGPPTTPNPQNMKPAPTERCTSRKRQGRVPLLGGMLEDEEHKFLNKGARRLQEVPVVVRE
jgi:hypothetical protein